VPHLLGFVPHDSLVLIVECAGEVEVAARANLPPEPWPALRARLTPLLDEQRRYLVLCYCDDPQTADTVNAGAVALLGQAQVIDTLHVVDEQFRRSGEQVWHRLDPSLSRWAQLDNSHVNRSREQVAALVAGPSAAAARAFARSCAAAKKRLTATNADLKLIADDLLNIGLVDAAALDENAAATLVVCLDEPQIRKRVWRRFQRENAAAYLKVFLALLPRVSQRQAEPLLGLSALAAWLAGEGTLQVCAVERGLALGGTDPLLRLAASVAENCTPPEAWERLRAQLGVTEGERYAIAA
jgi:hypothetical protein